MHFAFIPDHLAIGAASGLLVAAHLDYAAFQSWKSWDDALHYNWRMATWRWVQGAIVGIVSSGAVGAFVQ